MKVLPKRNNFLGLKGKYSSYKNSDIVVIQSPLEKTVSYGKGTKNGSKEILKASHYIEYFDEETKTELCFEKGICTFKEIKFGKLSVKKSIEKIYNIVKKLKEENKFVVTLGGEHSLSLAPIQAHFEKYNNISVLQIDSHSDLRESYKGCKYSHASVMARVAEFTTNIVQVGIRSQCKEEYNFIKKNKIKTFYMRDIRNNKFGKKWQKKVLDSLKENVYITFDVDGFDTSVILATGTPEPGGLFWDETMNLLKIIGKQRNLVGFDVVELAPSKFHLASSFNTAKLVYKILNYSFPK